MILCCHCGGLYMPPLLKDSKAFDNVLKWDVWIHKVDIMMNGLEWDLWIHKVDIVFIKKSKYCDEWIEDLQSEAKVKTLQIFASWHTIKRVKKKKKTLNAWIWVLWLKNKNTKIILWRHQNTFRERIGWRWCRGYSVVAVINEGRGSSTCQDSALILYLTWLFLLLLGLRSRRILYFYFSFCIVEKVFCSCHVLITWASFNYYFEWKVNRRGYLQISNSLCIQLVTNPFQGCSCN